MAKNLSGQVVLVTGASAGIGEATSSALAARGATVVLAGRDPARTEAARSRIAAATGSADLHVAIADLSTQQGVRSLASEVLERFDRLTGLVNNAGVDLGRRTVTADGLETTFAVNVLAPFLLSRLLTDRLRRSAPARIVNVASSAHRGGKIDFDDLQSERHFGQSAYNNSKLALVLLSREMAGRLDPAQVTVNCADPGFVRGTNLGKTLPFGYQVIGAVMLPFMATPAKGAATVVWAVTDPELATVTGGYLKNRRIAKADARADAPETARRLWEVTSRLAGLPAD